VTVKAVVIALGVAVLCWSHQALAFECPRPEKPSPDVLQET
jgi:hypothetical protein